MKNTSAAAGVIGVTGNLLLFFIKLYIGISSNCLSVYCDAINNLGDTAACGIALASFLLIRRMDERRGVRTQSLSTLFISIFIAVTGVYFIYNGLERTMYPLPVSYATRYAVLLAATVPLKALLGVVFASFNRKRESAILRALVLDSILDCFITLAALMSLLLIQRVNFAADGIFALITGGVITVSALRNIIGESRRLIND